MTTPKSTSVRTVVMTSGGKGSWMAARLAREERGLDGMVLLFSDTNGEDPDLYRFLEDAAEDIGAPLVVLDNDGQTVWDVFRKERMIGNTRLSVCSRALKQRPARKWLAEHTSPDVAHVVVGIDWTEAHRAKAITRSYAPWTVSAPLVERYDLDSAAVDQVLAAAGIAPPALYARGFSHNNCAGACVRAGQGQWAHLLKVDPVRYAAEEQQENEFRELVGKDVSILRDRRGGTTTPLTLTSLRERVERTPEQVDMFDLGGCGCVA